MLVRLRRFCLHEAPNMKRFFFSLLCASCVLSLFAGCETGKGTRARGSSVPVASIQAPKPKPVPVGHVMYVNRAHFFAQVQNSVTLEPGTELQSRNASGKERAKLRVSSIVDGNLIIVDIVTGMPQVGELVTK